MSGAATHSLFSTRSIARRKRTLLLYARCTTAKQTLSRCPPQGAKVGSDLRLLFVERIGLEPTTSCLQSDLV
jgi:hypothetical protein